MSRFPEHSYDTPKLIYICAPLRGDVEKNIAFARRKAQEVFQSGDVPICPHLLFPPIADPENSVEDQTAREMGLRLVEACQQVNVYGAVRTAGMQAEIRHAERLGIPVWMEDRTLEKGRQAKENVKKTKNLEKKARKTNER